jgi:hypothetical protein
MPKFFIPGTHPRRFRVERLDYPVGSVAPFGQLVPTGKAREREWGDIDVIGALIGWFGVRAAFRDWDRRRSAQIRINEMREMNPHMLDRLSREERRAPYGRQAARKKFDATIKECVNTYGPLGGNVRGDLAIGDDIEEMMDAIDDLRIWMSPGLSADSVSVVPDQRLARRLDSFEKSVRHVDIWMSMGDFIGGVLSSPNLYSALAMGLHYSQVLNITYHQCAAPRCGALFLAKRSHANTCSPNCRRALSRSEKPTG